MKESEGILLAPKKNTDLSPLPDRAFVTLIKYLEMKEVAGKMMLMNKKMRELILSENYILFKHFLRDFNILNERLKRTDIPAKVGIMQLLRDNYSLRRIEPSPQNLMPFSFFTDGGTFNDDTKYFINNIFSRSGVCYSSKEPKNTNVQLYMGRRVSVETAKMLPKDHKVGGKGNIICLPYAKYLQESSEKETFKVLGDLVIHNQGSGYTCFVNSFCFFISDREIKIAKSPVIKLFEDINTREKFEALGLPIKKVTNCPDGTANVAFEIDLANTR